MLWVAVTAGRVALGDQFFPGSGKICLVLFADLDAFFYEALQQSHVAVFEQQLERFLETSSFIEKMGICTYLAGYLAENDIALYNPNL